MNHKRHLTIFIASILLLFVAPLQASRVVETVGSASTADHPRGVARELAIKDAMQQAAMQSKVRVASTALSSSNVLVIESSRIDASGTVDDVNVIEEWIDDDLIHVRIRARVSEEHENTGNQVSPGYRKKVAVLQFDVKNRGHIQDVPGIELEWSRELGRRLEGTGNFISIDASQYLISATNPGYRKDYPESYAHLAEKLGAQIIISGVIRDMEIDRGFIYDSRKLEVEIFVHDGLSGARISHHRFSEMVEKGSVYKHKNTLFSNAEFLKTAFGTVLDRVLDRQAEMINRDLANIPFSARVVDIKGDEVIFNAGASSLVNVGDVLMTYRLSADPIRYRSDREFLGYRETPVATLSIKQVQPLFAIGKLEVDKAELFPGDIIRFGL